MAILLLALVLANPSYSFCVGKFCLGADTYTKTRHPILLVHGALGFETILGSLDYWYQIPYTLRRSGASVFVAEVSSVHHPIVRGEQLVQQIERILAETGAEKVNLMAHSLGAPTARYAASVRPDLVASVVSIGGTNTANTLGNMPLSFSDDGILDDIVSGLFTALGKTVNYLADAENQQGGEALLSFGKNIHQFNELFPEGLPPASSPCSDGPLIETNGGYYMSWSGKQAFTNALDPADYMLMAFDGMNAEEQNDGPVGRCDSHLGKTIRDDYKLNHFDEVNQTLGLSNPWETNPKSIYRQVANRLKNYGL
jgi:triacylglycerol lipase